MRLPWNKSKEVQLDLLDTEPGTTAPHQPVEPAPRTSLPQPDAITISPAAFKSGGHDGRPILVAVTLFHEDADNPRTEFPEAALEELAADIQQRGILQPLVVHPADGEGRYRIHFGAKRLRERSEPDCIRLQSSCATCLPTAMPRSPRTRSAMG